jgi:carboxyl-terminal processing protease
MKNKLIVLILIFSMVFSTFAFATESIDGIEKTEEESFMDDVEFMKLVAEFVKDKYLYDVSYEDIMDGLYKGMFENLDDYSVYFSAEEYADFSSDMSGEFSGVGIQIVNENDYVVVVTPLHDSPAEKAGIQAKDIIKYVDGTDITGYTTNEAATLIKGPVGTTVILGIERNNEIINFPVVRDHIVISSVFSEIMDDDIGYLKITQFNSNTLELIAEQMVPFMDAGVEKLVIDLRNNPGGSLSEVLNTLDLFVPAGPLAYVIKANGEETEYTSSLSIQNFELAVLVNEGSASASEIFAGAVQDRDAGTIIGTTTFGKGVVQTLYPLKDGSAMKLTTAEYLTAGRNHVHGIGITPDIIVENSKALSEIDTSDIPELTKIRKADVGIVGLDVLAAEKILKILGYPVSGPDGIFDENLKKQIAQYQADKGIYPYGVLDFTTQDCLTADLENYGVDESEDLQLEKALKILK